MSEIKTIWMSNDPGGCVRISRTKLWVVFANSAEKEFRIEAAELLTKLKECKPGYDFSLKGLEFIPGVVKEEGICMTSIRVENSSDDTDLAVVSAFDLKETLYFFVN